MPRRHKNATSGGKAQRKDGAAVFPRLSWGRSPVEQIHDDGRDARRKRRRERRDLDRQDDE